MLYDLTIFHEVSWIILAWAAAEFLNEKQNKRIRKSKDKKTRGVS